MIIKRLFEEYDLAVERILLKEYKRLKLTMRDMSVLLALFSIYKKRKTYSIASIGRRVELSSDDIGAALESLINQGFVSTRLESKDGKEREIFSLDETLEKIEELYRQDEIEVRKEIVVNDISETMTWFEQGLGRGLLPYELESIRRWYEEKAYPHETIKKAIQDAGERVSVKFVERILNQTIIKEVPIDQDVEEALDTLFKNIK